MSVKISRSILLPAAAVLLFIVLLALLDGGHLRYLTAKITGIDCPKKDRVRIEATIKAYNNILSDFYASGGNPKMINSFPTTKQIKHEVFRDLGYVKSADRILVYDMASITPFKIRLVAPGRAEAQYYEEWNYMYQNPDRTPKTRPTGFGIGFRYHLLLENGKWLVHDWDPDATVPDMSNNEFKF